MTRFADPNRCPRCGSTLVPGSFVCPSCRLDLSGPLGQELFMTLSRADQLLAALQERSAAPAQPVGMAAPTGPAGPAVATAPPPQTMPAPPSSPPPPLVPPVKASSVPKILLTLGAVCLLVAALVFLAVTWSVLGVGGRTVTLLVLTVAAGLLTRWVAGRGLRGATESLGLVTAGLVTLDVFGARNAGWLGDPSGAAFATGLGAVLVVGGLAATWGLASTRARGFTGGELTAIIGAFVLGSGLANQSWGSWPARFLVAVVVLSAVATGSWLLQGRRRVFMVAGIGTTVLAWLYWLGLVVAAVGDVGSEPTLADVWGHLQGWPLLVAAALAGAVALVRAVPTPLRVASAGAGVFALATLAVLPAMDETSTQATLAVLAVLVVLTVAVPVVGRPWGAAGLGAGTLIVAALAVQVMVLAGTAAQRYVDAAAELWDGTVDGSLPPAESTDPAPWLLPLCLLAVVAAVWAGARLLPAFHAVPLARAMTWLAWLAAAALGLGLFGLLLLSEVPVWAVVVPLLLIGVVAAGHGIGTAWWPTLAAGSVALLAALGLGLYDEWLTLAAVVVSLLVVTAVHLRTRTTALATAAAAVLPLLTVALVWTVGALVSGPSWNGGSGLPKTWTGFVAVIVLVALVLLRPLVPLGIRSEPVPAALEIGAAVGAVVMWPSGVDAAGADRAVWAAAYLSVAGAGVTAMALLRADRRDAGWIGGALLAAASWVRLADLGVEEPEPYVLPVALALLGVGLWKMRADPGTSTHRALGPAIVTGVLPSWLWSLDDPLSLRALLVGLACAGLVAVGVTLRWSAPLVYGSLFGVVLVIWEAAPYVDAAVPRWALIGAAGAVLIGTGITWEQRMTEARAVAGYVRRLR